MVARLPVGHGGAHESNEGEERTPPRSNRSDGGACELPVTGCPWATRGHLPPCNGVVIMARGPRRHDTRRAQERERAGRRTHPTAWRRGWHAGHRPRTPSPGRSHGHPAGRQRDGRESVRSACLCTRIPGSCTLLRLIRAEKTARGRLLAWVIVHGRFRVRPVLRCDDHTVVVEATTMTRFWRAARLCSPWP